MTNIIQNMAGMSGMTDQVIATDFLIFRCKESCIRHYRNNELRAALRQQLKAAV
jgi:similar to spore coat protein